MQFLLTYLYDHSPKEPIDLQATTVDKVKAVSIKDQITEQNIKLL
jgi:hypothetical protein